MRIFTTKVFQRWAKKQNLSPKLLKSAIAEIEQGLVDADLGHGLIKNVLPNLDGEKAVTGEPSWPTKQVIKHFSYTALKKAAKAISQKKKKRPCAS